MTTKLTPPPHPTVPIGRVGPKGQVILTVDWARYLTAGLLARLGGYEAPSITELEREIDALEARVDILEDQIESLGAWTEVEIDFGTKPVYSASFVIVNPKINETKLVRVMAAARAAEGRTADDWAWDGAVFAATSELGQATVYATFLPGPIVGPRKLQYSIG